MRLSVKHLVVDRGARRIVDDLSFAVEAGEALVLVGPNGAGKTTVIRTVAGLIGVAGGSIALEGGDAERELPAQAHYIGHLNALKPSLTVEENLRFWAAYLGGGVVDGAAIDAALLAFDLEPLAMIPAGYLSAGQKRRACLARLIATPRPLWLLDEPTVSLDAASVALLAKQVGQHVAGGGLVLAATHIPLGLASERQLEIGMRSAAA
ncbi:MAG: heme ABC exporter ATP-binding protein CcmA [Hyphomicrobium sp.]|nr:heme ABC exporter ATP-binding protein CcmA [Hyphomicrobium sp.]PPD07963.1 MAG: heme ABC exporter ATP-binding protein CcmA [Hyphomicrobium sp.]